MHRVPEEEELEYFNDNQIFKPLKLGGRTLSNKNLNQNLLVKNFKTKK